MKKILLASALLLATIVHAQNWELFKANETYNFNYDQIHGVRVDSVKAIANNRVFYFNRTLNDSIHRNRMIATYPIQDITQPNIFGEKVTERNDSLIFTNQFGNLLYLKPLTNINSLWNFIQLPSGRVEAKIDSVYVDSINHGLDSVKRISFQYYDSLNNPVNHPINAKQLIFSKANGIVSTFNLYEDAIGQSMNFNYKKTYNQIFRSTVFTNREVFDLDIGDEYHFQIHYSAVPTGPAPTDIRNHIVTGKSMSPNGDTLKLTILEYQKYESGVVDFSTNPPTVTYTTTYTNRTFDKTIVHPADTFTKSLGMEVVISNDTLFSPSFSAQVTSYSNTLPYNNGNFGQRITISTESQFFYYDSTQSSWVAPNYYSSPYSSFYLIGVFDFQNYYSNNGGSVSSFYHRMIYYKKGNKTWGTPQIVTGIENEVVDQKRTLLYPNPAQHELFLESGEQDYKKSYEIIDLKGRIVKRGTLTINLNIQELEAGVYFLKIVQAENTEVLKFIKE